MMIGSEHRIALVVHCSGLEDVGNVSTMQSYLLDCGGEALRLGLRTPGADQVPSTAEDGP